jgi:competence ComEA-like helix-hairpin-helix protein
MSIRGHIAGFLAKLRAAASQLYTPRELRALFAFLLVGLGVLLYRGAQRLYYTYFPEKLAPATRFDLARQDSLFDALSAASHTRDSLFFSLPEDSLLPPTRRQPAEHHLKEEGLRPNSISLNRGSKEDLLRLPGVGPATAERILEYRSQRGSFRSIEELGNLRGFGEKRMQKVRKYLRLN